MKNLIIVLSLLISSQVIAADFTITVKPVASAKIYAHDLATKQRYGEKTVQTNLVKLSDGQLFQLGYKPIYFDSCSDQSVAFADRSVTTGSIIKGPNGKYYKDLPIITQSSKYGIYNPLQDCSAGSPEEGSYISLTEIPKPAALPAAADTMVDAGQIDLNIYNVAE